MFFIYDILLSILFIILLSGIYFLGEKIKGSNTIMNSRVSNKFVETTEAIIFGAFFIALQIIFKDIYGSFIVTLFVVGFLVLFFIKGILFSSIVLAPGLLHFLVLSQFDESFYLIIATTFLTAFVFELTSFFLEGRETKMITYIFMFVFSILMFLISAFALGHGNLKDTFLRQAMPFIITIFVDFIFAYLIKFSLSANILYESINFDFSTYYRDSLLFSVLGTEISNKKISRGVFGVIELSTEETFFDEEEKELKEQMLLRIKNELPERTLLFKFDDKRYAFFLSTETLDKQVNITNEEAIFDIQTCGLKVNSIFRLENKKRFKAKIKMGISYYGEQTSSIKELETFSLYALETKHFKKDEYISIFDYAKYRKNIKDVVMVQQLDEVIGLDNYLLKFTPIFSTKTNKTKYMFCEPENISETQYIGDIRTYMQSIDKLEAFERFYTTEAIKGFKKNSGKYLIHFSASRLSEKSYFDTLLNSLNMKKINPKKIIIIVRPEEILNKKYFFENVKELENKGVKFAVYWKNKIPAKLKPKFKPEIFLVNDAENIDNKLANKIKKANIEVIFVGVETDEELLIANKKGVKNFGGSLFQSNLFPKIFDKQSKIYLNKTLKRRVK